MMILIFLLKMLIKIILIIMLIPRAIFYLIIGKKAKLYVNIIWLKPAGASAISQIDIDKSVAQLQESMKQIFIEVELSQTVVQPEIQTFGCNFNALFQAGFSNLEKNHIFDYKVITAYFVEDITDAGGCAFWGTSWCRIRPACTYDATILSHEIGHLLNLPHTSDKNNVMYAKHGGETNQLNHFQRFLMLLTPHVR